MKLNLGCGEHYAEGWTNIDFGAKPGAKPDIVGDVTKPFPALFGRCERLYAGHIIEHLHPDTIVPTLRMWKSYLIPGGRMMVVGPDVNSTMEMFYRKEIDRHQKDAALYGCAERPGGKHQIQSTIQITSQYLHAAQWEPYPIDIRTFDPNLNPDLAQSSKEWPIVSHAAWQFCILAIPKV